MRLKIAVSVVRFRPWAPSVICLECCPFGPLQMPLKINQCLIAESLRTHFPTSGISRSGKKGGPSREVLVAPARIETMAPNNRSTNASPGSDWSGIFMVVCRRGVGALQKGSRLHQAHRGWQIPKTWHRPPCPLEPRTVDRSLRTAVRQYGNCSNSFAVSTSRLPASGSPFSSNEVNALACAS